MSLRNTSINLIAHYSNDLNDGLHVTSAYKGSLPKGRDTTTIYKDGFWANIEYLKQEVNKIDDRVNRIIPINRRLLADGATWLTPNAEKETIMEEVTTIFRNVRSNIHDMGRYLEENKQIWNDAEYRMHKVHYTEIFRRFSIVMKQYLQEQAILCGRSEGGIDVMVENPLWIPLEEQGNKEAYCKQISKLENTIQQLEKKMTELQLFEEINSLVNEFDDDSNRIDLQVELAREHQITPVEETIRPVQYQFYRRSRREQIVKWLTNRNN
ncbi:syntaxin-like isoform X8 [Oopsacas minuta]|uniref:Syntaxin-like isoform X8 n=1 Tax=Oopsacas minuta TaxID=111878 RepID=A0AAV7JPV5_9METZ|nr:syntaxin-like isoform X8 [Oopsacas minuta]